MIAETRGRQNKNIRSIKKYWVKGSLIYWVLLAGAILFVTLGRGVIALGLVGAYLSLSLIDYALYRIRARAYREHDRLYFSDGDIVRAEDETCVVWTQDEAGSLDHEYRDRWDMTWLHQPRLDRLNEIIAPLRGRLIDAGCGAGKLIRSLRHRETKEIYGFDIVVAKGMAEFLGPDIRYTCASVDAAPFKSEVADILVCSEVLEHLRHPEKAVWECWRMLRPGGCFVASVPSAAIFPSTLNPFVIVERMLTPFTGIRRGYKPHAILLGTDPQVTMALHKLYDRGEFLDLVQSQAFEIKSVESVAFGLGPLEPFFRIIRRFEKAANGRGQPLFDLSFRVYSLLVRVTEAVMRRLPIFKHMGAVVLVVAEKKENGERTVARGSTSAAAASQGARSIF